MKTATTQETHAREAAKRIASKTGSPEAEYYDTILEAITSATSELERENERCDECNAELSACGFQNPDGTPSMDCLVCQLRSDLESARKQIAEKDECFRWIIRHLSNLPEPIQEDIAFAIQQSYFSADSGLNSATGSNYVSVEHPVIVEMERALTVVSDESKERDILCDDGFTFSYQRNSKVHKSILEALAAFQKLKGEKCPN